VLTIELRVGRQDVRVLDMTVPGLRALQFLALLEDLLALGPRVVVVELNLRTLAPQPRPRGAVWLGSFARSLRLRDAVSLGRSLAAEGLSVLDLAWLRLKERLGLGCALDGLRAMLVGRLAVAASGATAALGLRRGSPVAALERMPDDRPMLRADFAAHPSTQLLRTLREKTLASGARVVFYVPPLPPPGVGSPDAAAAAGIARRIEDLRVALGATEEEWLDLHDGAAAPLFLDASGHLRTNGCELVGRPIAERVLPLLGE